MLNLAMSQNNILIIESNAKNLESLIILLKKETYEVASISSKEQLETLDTLEEVHLVLINTSVDFIKPKEILTLIADKLSTITPVIFMDSSKVHDKEMLKTCLDNGAVDYIKKPFDTHELLGRVKLHITQYFKFNACKLRVDKLANLATLDQLTKLSSKVHMQAILKHQVDLFERYKDPAALIYIRLLQTDKAIGTFSFEHGEKLISRFARELKPLLRDSDVVARWSGSDFIIYLPHTDNKASMLVAKKLNTTLITKEILPNTTPHLSFGVSDFKEGDTSLSIVDKAKSAMVEASKLEYGRIVHAP